MDVTPFGFLNKNKPTGMMFEAGSRIAEEAGLEYTNTIVPYARTIIALQNGNADFVLRYSNEILPSIAVPLVSIITIQNVILFRADTNIKDLESLQGKTVARVRGGRYDVNFAKNENITKVEVNNYSQMLRMLMAGRIDGAIGSNVGLYYNARQLGITQEMLGKPMLLDQKDIVLHFSKKNTDSKIRERLKRSVEKLKNDNEFKNIVNKYMGNFNWDIGCDELVNN